MATTVGHRRRLRVEDVEVMSCDIFIRSYYRDFEWLSYCLASIARYCRGFRRTVLVVPEKSRPRLEYLGLAGDRTFTCKSYADDYLGQQVTKLQADWYTDARYICHVDSDCIFHRPTTPEDLFFEGKPRIVMTPYDRRASRSSWQGITRKFLGREVAFDFMQQLPLVYPRSIYHELRHHVEAVHGSDLESYVTSQPYRGFSEFNAFGAFVYYRHHDRFAWIDASRQTVPEPRCLCFWSWGGIDEATRAAIDEALGDRVTE